MTAGVIDSPLVLPGCMGHWVLNGDPLAQRGTVKDRSGLDHNGTWYGSPAIDFDGVNDDAHVAVTWDEIGGHRFSAMRMQFIADSATSGNRLLYAEYYAGGAIKWYVQLLDSDQLLVWGRCNGFAGAGEDATSTGTISQDEWHSLLVVIDCGTDRVHAWLDGQRFMDGDALSGDMGAEVWEADVPNTQIFGLTAGASWDFDGRMCAMAYAGLDDLPSDRDAQLIHEFPFNLQENIAWNAWWPCHENAGNPQDHSGAGHHLALVGASWDVGANLGQDWIRADASDGDRFQQGGADFERTRGQRIFLGTTNDLNLHTNWSLFGVAIAGGPGVNRLWSRFAGGTGMQVYWDGGNGRIGADDGVNTPWSPNASWPGGCRTWAAVETGGNIQFYLNGVASGAAQPFLAASKLLTDTWLGADGAGGNTWIALQYEVRAFNRALGPGEIRALHAHGSRYL